MVKKLVWVSLVLLVVAQVIRPARTNPPVDPALTLESTAAPPVAIADILERGCRDCHTYETVWPWYSNVAPASWLLVMHVNEGREHVNFSTWGSEPVDEQVHLLDEICEEVEDGAMPMPSYVRVHESAALTDADRQAVCEWTRAETVRLQSTP